MPTNAELRTVQFSQGVEINLPSGVLDDNGQKIIINNAANTTTGLKFKDNAYREVIIDYSIRRRTDTTTGLIERGRLRLTANPDALLLADRWILSYDNENDNGALTGVTLSMLITDEGGGVSQVDLLYTSSNLAGANHNCVMSYALTSFLV